MPTQSIGEFRSPATPIGLPSNLLPLKPCSIICPLIWLPSWYEMVSPILRQPPQIKSLCLIGRSMTTINVLMISKSPFLPVFGPIFVAVLESFGDPRMSWCQVLPLTDFSLETAKPLGCLHHFHRDLWPLRVWVPTVDDHTKYYHVYPCVWPWQSWGISEVMGDPQSSPRFSIPRKAPSCATVADMPTSPGVDMCVTDREGAAWMQRSRRHVYPTWLAGKFPD